MPRIASNSASSSIVRPLAVGLLVVATLYFGREILLPLALAMLMSFALAPLVSRLERIGLPVVASVIVTAGLCFAVLGGIGYVVTGEVLELAADLPQHRENLKERLRSLRGGSGGALGKAADMVEEIQKEIDEEEAADEPGVEAPEPSPYARRAYESVERLETELLGRSQPLPVQIVQPTRPLFERIPNLLGPLLGPLATAGIVVVFVTFILLQRRDLRDRLIALAGETRLDLTTQAMNEAGSRISRYLLAQLTIAVLYGLPVGLGLWLIGVPGAVLWGVLSMVLRFIPYIGPWLSAVLPVLLSVAVFQGWGKPLAVIGLFVGLELFSNNVIEPWLYGASTGMSAVAVIFAAVFWGWMWGAIGILLSIPLTVCLVVLGKYVPHLRGLSILLGREPALDPATRFYQRVLAMDDDEASDIAEEYVAEHGLIELYDDVLIPALHYAERDRHGERVDAERAAAVSAELRSLVEEHCGWKAAEEGAPPAASSRPILCLPARDDADEIAACMLVDALRSVGFAGRSLSVTHLASEAVEVVRAETPSIVCISAVPPGAVAHSRYLAMRLHAALPDVQIVIGLWDWNGDPARATTRLRNAGADFVVTSVAGCLAHVKGLAPALALLQPAAPVP